MRGYGLAGDAYHIAAPTEDGDGPSRAMLAAIGKGGLFFQQPSVRESICEIGPVS